MACYNLDEASITARMLEAYFTTMAISDNDLDRTITHITQLPPVTRIMIADAIERAMFDDRDGEQYGISQFVLKVLRPTSTFIDKEES